MKDTVDLVADLIRLRRWAIGQLGSPHDRRAPRALRVPHVSAETWTLFLALERCASPLLDSMIKQRVTAEVSDEVRSMLTAAANRETVRVLAAEREARNLGAAAALAGTRFIVLKGGVPALLGMSPALHVHDLDILVTDDSRSVAASALSAAGFTKSEHDEPHHAHWDSPTMHVPVEVHWTIQSDGSPMDPAVLSRTVPLDPGSGLSRLDFTDQLLHILQHCLDQHADQHVSLRDVLLAGWYFSRLDTEDRARLMERLATFPASTRYRKLLAFSESLQARSATGDPFETDTILHFTAAVLTRRGSLWRGGPPPAWRGAATVAQGRVSLAGLVAFGSKRAVTGVGRFAAIQRTHPRAGAALTRAARGVHYLLSAAVGAPLLLTARRAVREALEEGEADR